MIGNCGRATESRWENWRQVARNWASVADNWNVWRGVMYMHRKWAFLCWFIIENLTNGPCDVIDMSAFHWSRKHNQGESGEVNCFAIGPAPRLDDPACSPPAPYASKYFLASTIGCLMSSWWGLTWAPISPFAPASGLEIVALSIGNSMTKPRPEMVNATFTCRNILWCSDCLGPEWQRIRLIRSVSFLASNWPEIEIGAAKTNKDWHKAETPESYQFSDGQCQSLIERTAIQPAD